MDKIITIKFTALPKKFFVAGKKTLLTASVFVSPEINVPLDGNEILGNFDIFNDWPSTLQNWLEKLSPVFVINQGSTIVRYPVTGIDKPLLHGDLSGAWKYLFEEHMPVEDKNQNNIYKNVDPQKLTRSVMPEKAVTKQYTDYLSSYYSNKLNGLSADVAAKTRIRANLVNGQHSGELIKHLKHQSLGFSRHANSTDGMARVKKREKLSFNQLVSHLGQFPSLLKGLGLIFDLTIDVTDSVAKIDGIPGNIYFGFEGNLPPSSNYELDMVFPQVVSKFNLSDKVNNFCPMHNTSLAGDDLVSNRLLYITDSSVKDVNAPRSIVPDIHDAVALSYKMQKASTATDNNVLPALTHRTSGIVLNHEQLHIKTNNYLLTGFASLVTKGTPPVFYAEDLIRGYRIDVRKMLTTAKWSDWASLCRQTLEINDIAGYLPSYITDQFVDNEGWVSISQTYAQTESATDDTYLVVPGALTRWEGWSLCVPRPGKGQLNNGSTGTSLGGYSNFNKLKIEKHVVPGSLMKLRYGEQYQFRIRTVDIAGNGLTRDEASTIINSPAGGNFVTDPILFSRPETLQTPVLVPHDQIFTEENGNIANISGTEGENVDVMVVRSECRRNSDVSAIMSHNCIRHILPPQVSPDMAEKLGSFDNVKPVDSYKMIIDHDGTLSKKGYEEVDQLSAPFLADPAVIGFSITGADIPANNNLFPFYGKDTHNYDWQWPNARPWKIIVRPADVSTAFSFSVDGRNNAIIISLPQVDMRKIYISPVCNASFLTNQAYLFTSLGLQSKISALIKSGNGIVTMPSMIADKYLVGMASDIFPSKTINLVHAVQKPLYLPLIKNLSMSSALNLRALNSTMVSLSLIPFSWQAKSSEKVELFGTWTDYEDTPENFGPTAMRSKKISEFPLNYTDSPAAVNRVAKDEFGDTKRRIITYQIGNVSRFGNYFPLQTDLARFSNFVTPIIIDIPSSAKPSAPAVKRIVPTYGHIRKRNQQQYQNDILDVNSSQLLSGNGLRIYLETGDWYSSGIGEVLGIVVLDPSQIKNFTADPLTPNIFVLDNHFISVIGKDTARDTSDINLLTTKNFKNNITEDNGNGQWFKKFYSWLPAGNGNAGDDLTKTFVLPEVKISEDPNSVSNGLPCNIVRYEVNRTYDNNELYAEILFDKIQTYFPFVRLVVVKLQPNAIDGCNVSSIAQLDYCRLPSDRLVTVSHRLGKITNINIDTQKQFNKFNIFYVSVEEIDPFNGIIFREDTHNIASSKIGRLFPCTPDHASPGNWIYNQATSGGTGLPLDFPIDHEIVIYEFENFHADNTISLDPLNDNLMNLVSMEHVKIF